VSKRPSSAESNSQLAEARVAQDAALAQIVQARAKYAEERAKYAQARAKYAEARTLLHSTFAEVQAAGRISPEESQAFAEYVRLSDELFKLRGQFRSRESATDTEREQIEAATQECKLAAQRFDAILKKADRSAE